MNIIHTFAIRKMVGGTMSYAKRQMEVFRSLGTVPDDWTWNGSIEETENPCELCGCTKVKFAFPLISTPQTGQKVLLVGSECVITYSSAQEQEKNELLGRAKRLYPRAVKLSRQAKITVNDALRILLAYYKRIDDLDGKIVFWAYTGFLYGVIHQNYGKGGPKLYPYEISSIVAQMLLRQEVTEYDSLYLRRLRKRIKKIREERAESNNLEVGF